LWDELPAGDDTGTACLKAYKKAGNMIETTGKTELIRLLYLNRTHEADWRGMLHW